MNFAEENATPESAEKSKKQSRLNALIVAAVLLLGVFAPHPYKAFAPILFIIPLIISAVNKARQVGGIAGKPASDQIRFPPLPGQNGSIDPYSYTPKDPKDPRRYKPIG